MTSTTNQPRRPRPAVLATPGHVLLSVLALVAAVSSATLSVLLTGPAQAQPAAQEATMSDVVLMETNMGPIVIELDRENAPISTENFLQYVESGHYDGTIFHRVIGTFMIQGGGFLPTLEQKPTRDPIKNEWQNGLKNDPYTIAMARTSDPDSATSQFFINVVDNDMLDMPRDGAAYAVFGKVISGRETVDAIKQVRTAFIAFTDANRVQRAQGGTMVMPQPNAPRNTPPSMQDVPVADVIITKASRLSSEQAAEYR